tara:strand:- start:3288 stop:3635 length:348 start_codon:yes stop_codon:yes gene_type:complete
MTRNSKLNLGELKGLTYRGEHQTKCIREWINHDSEFIYFSCYESSKHGFEYLELAKEATHHLKKTLLQQGFNELSESIKVRKRGHELEKKLTKAYGSGGYKIISHRNKNTPSTPF